MPLELQVHEKPQGLPTTIEPSQIEQLKDILSRIIIHKNELINETNRLIEMLRTNKTFSEDLDKLILRYAKEIDVVRENYNNWKLKGKAVKITANQLKELIQDNTSRKVLYVLAAIIISCTVGYEVSINWAVVGPIISKFIETIQANLKLMDSIKEKVMEIAGLPEFKTSWEQFMTGNGLNLTLLMNKGTVRLAMSMACILFGINQAKNSDGPAVL